jgi:hypothetical protein
MQAFQPPRLGARITRVDDARVWKRLAPPCDSDIPPSRQVRNPNITVPALDLPHCEDFPSDGIRLEDDTVHHACRVCKAPDIDAIPLLVEQPC